nr:RNA-binding domain-containing protein [Sulfolobus acidocaldarius]
MSSRGLGDVYKRQEDKDKVINAIRNFFDFDKIREEEHGMEKLLIAESNSLTSLLKLHRLLREQRILDAARKYLMKSIVGSRITFMLNKQVAAIGKLSFIDKEHESPLGPIKVTIDYKDPVIVVDWLTPKTAKGVPLWENAIPPEE